MASMLSRFALASTLALAPVAAFSPAAAQQTTQPGATVRLPGFGQPVTAPPQPLPSPYNMPAPAQPAAPYQLPYQSSSPQPSQPRPVTAPVLVPPPVYAPPPRAYAAPAGVSGALSTWRYLTSAAQPGFAEIVYFLNQNPDWPGQDAMRRKAERAAIDYAVPADQTIAFFTRFPPLTAGGHLRHALALQRAGRRADAMAAARRAWTEGSMAAGDDGIVLSQFAGALTVDDHDERMNRLLLQGNTSDAARQLPYTSASRRAVFDARLSMRGNWPDAYAKMPIADAAGQSDPGYIVDKATWLRQSGNWVGARQLLAAPHSYARVPGDAVEYYATLLLNAKAAATDGQWQIAYGIAQGLDAGLPAGTDVKTQPFKVRDLYTDLAWLGGNTALRRLGRAGDAIGLFTRYAQGGQSPQVRAKGYYWAGRAAQQAGKATDAERYFTLAAQEYDQFYGQLANERLGRPQPVPPAVVAPALAASARQAFSARTVVQAVRWLGQTGDWKTQSQFVRAIAEAAKSDSDHYLAGELAKEIARPDLAVMVGRSARSNGHDQYLRAAFPTVSIPASEADQWSIVHAISRQESQFDRQIMSRAGALGLMQLMPGTAREQAGKMGLPYDPSRLTADPAYNMQLGSGYFRRLWATYGSYPLAVAAYNAGGGNVNKWLAQNGDPRTGAIAMLDWIDAIPFSETRNYVERVLENAVVYDTINPNPGARRPRNPLSWYLGKSQPG